MVGKIYNIGYIEYGIRDCNEFNFTFIQTDTYNLRKIELKMSFIYKKYSGQYKKYSSQNKSFKLFSTRVNPNININNGIPS
jgi:hypothetical protein